MIVSAEGSLLECTAFLVGDLSNAALRSVFDLLFDGCLTHKKMDLIES